MNFLYISVKNSIFDIALVLKSMGHSVTIMEQHQFDPIDPGPPELLVPIEKELREHDYDYAISYLYDTTISGLCQKYDLPYIAWIYDSPLLSVFHESIFNPVNRIFIFDHAFYDRLVQLGIPHVYYMPLAANTTRINVHSFMQEDMDKFSSDISFVGSLYEKNAYNQWANKLPDEILLPINHYLMKNLCNWNSIRPWPLMTPECTAIFSGDDSPYTPFLTNFQMPASLYLGIVFYSRKLAEMERITALNTLAGDYKVDLYTSGSSELIDAINTHPAVHYYKDLGCIYHFSKINLNFTLPSIETGVPLRIFDIMAYGGFVLSNYQQEYSSLFEIGKDLAVFHDLNEMKEQARYYLEHEEERIAIAAHGYQTVNRYFSYEHQLNSILDICQKIK